MERETDCYKNDLWQFQENFNEKNLAIIFGNFPVLGVDCRYEKTYCYYRCGNRRIGNGAFSTQEFSRSANHGFGKGTGASFTPNGKEQRRFTFGHLLQTGFSEIEKLPGRIPDDA